MSKIVKSSSTSFEDQLYKAMNERFSQLQRKAGLSGGGETRGVYQHSGMCMLDIVLGGGVPPGGWISAVGPEGSAKSTATQTIMVNCAGQVPINRMWDYEGSSDLNYLENIMRTDHIKMSLDELLGVKDKKGNVLVPGRVTYQDANVLEDFFDIEAAFLRSLPDKLYLDGGWWYCFDDDKYGREMVGGKHDKNMKAKYGKLCVPAKDGTMQAILLIDSLPSMLPRSMDVEDAKAGMALQARLFSDNIKKVKGKLRSKKVTILAVNQLREKPGVLYGDPLYEPCFVGSTQVLLADGSSDTIRNIVLKKRKVKVLSFNKDTGEVSAKRVIGWKDNGSVPREELVKVSYRSYSATGMPTISSFTSTKNHKIWTPSGWVEASKLTGNSTIYLNLPEDTYNEDQWQVLYGTLLGDGVLSSTSKSLSWNVNYNHVRYQVPYMMWKAAMIDYGNPFDIPNDCNVQRYKPNGVASGFTTFKHFSPKMAYYAKHLTSNHTKYTDKQNKIVSKILNRIDARGLAVWYMDDGHFANDRKNGLWVITITCNRFSKNLKKKSIDSIKRITGAHVEIDKTHGKLVIKGKENCLKFLDTVAEYIHPSVSYKLFNTQDCCSYEWEMTDPTIKNKLFKTKVLSVDEADIKTKYASVYDLTVEDNHTYFVCSGGARKKQKESRVRRFVRCDAVAVSNCGQAARFYSDCRIRFSSRSSVRGIKGKFEEEEGVNGGTDTYMYIHARAHKNKFGAQNVEGWFRVWVSDKFGKGHGFDPVFDTLEYLNVTGQVEGRRNKLTIRAPGCVNKKSLTHLQFKTLIIGNVEQVTKVQRDCGMIGKKDKAFRIRNVLKKQMKSGKGLDLFFKHKAENGDGQED